MKIHLFSSDFTSHFHVFQIEVLLYVLIREETKR